MDIISKDNFHDYPNPKTKDTNIPNSFYGYFPWILFPRIISMIIQILKLLSKRHRFLFSRFLFPELFIFMVVWKF